jgi:hypothetical protein
VIINLEPLMINLSLTGAYYWCPRPTPVGVTWELVTCHDLDVWDAVSHREFWPAVLEYLARLWGKDPKLFYRRLFDHHTGLPRGRITHPKSGYIVIHGDDAPVIDWLVLVKQKFRLAEVTPLYTEHEKMLGDDPQAVEDVLGISFHEKTSG